MKNTLTICLTAMIGFTLATVVFAQEAMKANDAMAPKDAMMAANEEMNETANEEMKEAVNAEVNAAMPAAEAPKAAY